MACICCMLSIKKTAIQRAEAYGMWWGHSGGGVGFRSCKPFYLPGQSERKGGRYDRVGDCIVPSRIWIDDVIFSGSAIDFYWIFLSFFHLLYFLSFFILFFIFLSFLFFIFYLFFYLFVVFFFIYDGFFLDRPWKCFWIDQAFFMDQTWKYSGSTFKFFLDRTWIYFWSTMNFHRIDQESFLG